MNALGASCASGLTYLRNVLPQLSRRQSIQTTVAISSQLNAEFATLNRIQVAALPEMCGTAQRFWFEQTQLPKVIQELKADVLISAGNFALRRSPVPQVLLSGNALYTSADFYHDLLSRHEYKMWLETRMKAALAKRSVLWADYTVAPTRSFADELLRWTGKTAVSIPHGFDREVFFSDPSQLPQQIQSRLDSAKNDLKLLYVSHYNYFRNFETLFRALPLIRERLIGRRVRLFLTCKLEDGQNPGLYRTVRASHLVKELGIETEVVELGALPYYSLHHLYCASDLYVTPSYAETFAHPLIEARACGLRVVASDIPVHREVCGDAALYFSRFSPSELANRVLEAAECRSASAPGSPQFSWSDHVDQILNLAASLTRHRLAA